MYGTLAAKTCLNSNTFSSVSYSKLCSRYCNLWWSQKHEIFFSIFHIFATPKRRSCLVLKLFFPSPLYNIIYYRYTIPNVSTKQYCVKLESRTLPAHRTFYFGYCIVHCIHDEWARLDRVKMTNGNVTICMDTIFHIPSYIHKYIYAHIYTTCLCRICEVI